MTENVISMRNFILLAGFLFFTEFPLFSQYAEVYVCRPKAYAGAGVPISVFMDGQKIGQLDFGERLIYRTNAYGNHLFLFQMISVKTDLSLNLEKGGKYFIETNSGLTRLKADLYDEAAGRALFEDLARYRKDSKPEEVFAGSTATGQVPDETAGKEKPVFQSNAGQGSQTAHSATPGDKRIALVIGNGDYTYGGYLRNPLNDADDMASVLKQLGFEVILVKNADLTQLKKSIDDFGRKLSSFDVGLFYYAGHGLQSKGYNYFIPVDANLQTESQVEFDCVRTDRLLGLMEEASNSTNIIILDACRNNPFERSWSRSANGSGLAFMDAPSGSLIAYSTSPGKTASDGYGRNGLYTSALLQHITEPGISIEQMFKKVRETVSGKSNQEQVPWESTSLLGNFYFAPTQEK